MGKEGRAARGGLKKLAHVFLEVGRNLTFIQTKKSGGAEISLEIS